MNITVLGAGAWGTALAIQACRRHKVMLWARNPVQAQSMQTQLINKRYLPQVALPSELHITGNLDGAISHTYSSQSHQGLFIVATPMAGLRELLQKLPQDSRVIGLCKGLEADTGLLSHEIAKQVRPDIVWGTLSGPSFAHEVATHKPTALVAASADTALSRHIATALHSEYLRIYTSSDPIGVEVGGALKNVLAIATGVCDGVGLGLNARAALITRGLAEISRFGMAMGAREQTFMGLSGLGDLVLTTTGDLSRNRKVGLGLATGQTLANVLAHLGHVAEGVYSAPTIAQRAVELGVQMPITQAVVDLLAGHIQAQQAVAQLLARDIADE